jgi:hypothetical protein
LQHYLPRAVRRGGLSEERRCLNPIEVDEIHPIDQVGRVAGDFDLEGPLIVAWMSEAEALAQA